MPLFLVVFLGLPAITLVGIAAELPPGPPAWATIFIGATLALTVGGVAVSLLSPPRAPGRIARDNGREPPSRVVVALGILAVVGAGAFFLDLGLSPELDLSGTRLAGFPPWLTFGIGMLTLSLTNWGCARILQLRWAEFGTTGMGERRSHATRTSRGAPPRH